MVSKARGRWAEAVAEWAQIAGRKLAPMPVTLEQVPYGGEARFTVKLNGQIVMAVCRPREVINYLRGLIKGLNLAFLYVPSCERRFWAALEKQAAERRQGQA